MRSVLRAVHKVIVTAATMCSGLIVAETTIQRGKDGREGGQGIKQKQGLDRAA